MRDFILKLFLGKAAKLLFVEAKNSKLWLFELEHSYPTLTHRTSKIVFKKNSDFFFPGSWWEPESQGCFSFTELIILSYRFDSLADSILADKVVGI